MAIKLLLLVKIKKSFYLEKKWIFSVRSTSSGSILGLFVDIKEVILWKSHASISPFIK